MRINRQHKKPFNKSQRNAAQGWGRSAARLCQGAASGGSRHEMSDKQGAKKPEETEEIKEQGRGGFPGYSTAAGVCSPKPVGSPALRVPSFS